eukprot:2165626-Prymnesium_polylepis.1
MRAAPAVSTCFCDARATFASAALALLVLRVARLRLSRHSRPPRQLELRPARRAAAARRAPRRHRAHAEVGVAADVVVRADAVELALGEAQLVVGQRVAVGRIVLVVHVLLNDPLPVTLAAHGRGLALRRQQAHALSGGARVFELAAGVLDLGGFAHALGTLVHLRRRVEPELALAVILVVAGAAVKPILAVTGRLDLPIHGPRELGGKHGEAVGRLAAAVRRPSAAGAAQGGRARSHEQLGHLELRSHVVRHGVGALLRVVGPVAEVVRVLGAVGVAELEARALDARRGVAEVPRLDLVVVLDGQPLAKVPVEVTLPHLDGLAHAAAVLGDDEGGLVVLHALEHRLVVDAVELADRLLLVDELEALARLPILAQRLHVLVDVEADHLGGRILTLLLGGDWVLGAVGARARLAAEARHDGGRVSARDGRARVGQLW